MASEFLEIAEQLMRREGRALTAKELVHFAQRDGLFSDRVAGRTPQQTMKSKLSVHIRRLGNDSLFVRTSPGRFFLRDAVREPRAIYQALPHRPPPSSEEVLLFPSAWLAKRFSFQGLKTKGIERLLGSLLSKEILSYKDRRTAETIESHKQIITYILVKRGSRVLSYKRGNYTRVEDYLKGARCIGFGGHMTSADLPLFGLTTYGILESAARELREELRLPPLDQSRLAKHQGLRIVGVINDDATATGRRHFAIVIEYQTSSDEAWESPVRNEKSITQLRWLDPAASADALFQYEYWSQLCLLEFYGQAQITRPTYVIRKRESLRPPHLLILLGEIGSGKTSTGEILKKDFSYREINSGRILATLLGMKPVTEVSRSEFQRKAWHFIESKDGPGKLARALWSEFQSLTSGRVFVDGIRQRATLEALRKIANTLQLGVIYVHTPFNMAYAFYRERASGDRTLQEFIAARNSPVEMEVGELAGQADAVLYKWRGKKSYRDMVHAFLKDIGVTP